MLQVGALLAVPLVERIERKYLITGDLTLIGAADIIFGTSTSNVVIVRAEVTITITNSVVSSALTFAKQISLFPTGCAARRWRRYGGTDPRRKTNGRTQRPRPSTSQQIETPQGVAA